MKHHLLTRPRTTVLLTALAMGLGSAGLVSLSSPALAAPVVKKGGPSVTLNFVNAEIEGVARAMGAILNRQIMVDPRVKGAITLYSDQPLTPREAYLNFLAALRGQGFALVEVAGLLKIVPEAEAKLQTGTVDVGTVKRTGDQVLTQIFRLQHEAANSLVTVLRPLISPNNTINANPSTNTLVITDYADNLQRIGQIIAAMDVPSVSDTEAIPLQYAIAADIAPMVQRLADGGGTAAPGAAGTQATLVMADSRTNTLLVRSPSAARMALVRQLVRQLDRPGSAGIGGSGIHVVYLKNADAVKLAQVLRAAFPGSGGSSGGGSGASPTPTSTNPAAGGANSSGASNTGASAQSTAPVAASAQPSTGGFIQADPATNSLIITATDSLYRQLRAVIDQLDGRRAQIYIEAMIVKVDANKAAQLGVQWAAASGDRNILGAATNLPLNGSLTSIPGLATTVAGGASALTGLEGFSVGLARRLSDGTYSMGGHAALGDLLTLQEKYGLFLYLDDSHSLSIVGRHGEGYVRSHIDQVNENTIIVATLNKAFGTSGAAIMFGPKGKQVEDILTRFGGPMAWSQPMNTAAIGASLASAELHRGPELALRQNALSRNIQLFDEFIRTEQAGNAFPIRLVQLPNDKVIRSGRLLFENGFYVSPVFFPIVAKDNAGLRVMLRSTISEEQVLSMCELLRGCIES